MPKIKNQCFRLFIFLIPHIVFFLFIAFSSCIDYFIDFKNINIIYNWEYKWLCVNGLEPKYLLIAFSIHIFKLVCGNCIYRAMSRILMNNTQTQKEKKITWIWMNETVENEFDSECSRERHRGSRSGRVICVDSSMFSPVHSSTRRGCLLLLSVDTYHI